VAAFATALDLADYLQRPVFSGDDLAAANLALELATAAVRADCRWPVGQETRTDTFLNARDPIQLATRRLTAISAVVVNGETWTADRYSWTSTGRVSLPGLSRYFNRPTVAITFTHGYSTGELDSDVLPFKHVTLEKAAAILSNPEGVRTEQIGGVQFTYPAAARDLQIANDPRLDDHRLVGGFA
jgi:hypothetical protein